MGSDLMILTLVRIPLKNFLIFYIVVAAPEIKRTSWNVKANANTLSYSKILWQHYSSISLAVTLAN